MRYLIGFLSLYDDSRLTSTVNGYEHVILSKLVGATLSISLFGTGL
jgi:hypothetical protein